VPVIMMRATTGNRMHRESQNRQQLRGENHCFPKARASHSEWAAFRLAAKSSFFCRNARCASPGESHLLDRA
jgi:hypothetical protein